jgi:hypothetical protein
MGDGVLMIHKLVGDCYMALGAGIRRTIIMTSSTTFQGMDQIGAQADVTAKAIAIMNHIHRFAGVAGGAVAFRVGGNVISAHGRMVDLGVWADGLDGVADRAISAAEVVSGIANEGAILVMTGGATVSPVQAVDQVGVGVTNYAGGGGTYLGGVRGGKGMDIEIGVAVHAITRTMREGDPLQQAGGVSVAIPAIPFVDASNKISTVTGSNTLRGGVYLAAMISGLGVAKEIVPNLSMAGLTLTLTIEGGSTDQGPGAGI